MRISEEQLTEAIDEWSERVKVEDWRHGTKVTYVFKFEDKPYLVTIPIHTEEGWQPFGRR